MNAIRTGVIVEPLDSVEQDYMDALRRFYAREAKVSENYRNFWRTVGAIAVGLVLFGGAVAVLIEVYPW